MEMMSQNDKAWKNDKMGNTKCTIGKYGCAITSLCNIANMNGDNFTPKQLNTYLSTTKDGYQNGANVTWAIADKFLGLKTEPFWWLAGHGEPTLDFNNINVKYICRYLNGTTWHFTNLIGVTKTSYIVYDVYADQLDFIKKDKVDRIIKVEIL